VVLGTAPITSALLLIRITGIGTGTGTRTKNKSNKTNKSEEELKQNNVQRNERHKETDKYGPT